MATQLVRLPVRKRTARLLDRMKGKDRTYDEVIRSLIPDDNEVPSPECIAEMERRYREDERLSSSELQSYIDRRKRRRAGRA